MESYPGQTGKLISINSNCFSCHTHYYNNNICYLQLNYVLDTGRPAAEIIVKEGPLCITREEFWSLGLLRDMDSYVSTGKLINTRKGNGMFFICFYACSLMSFNCFLQIANACFKLILEAAQQHVCNFYLRLKPKFVLLIKLA